ncbi:MAG: hypothetical protein LBR36_05130 [Bacteroidales bacterium]|jgi:hypothetical protein|nr:hypothetical protein [Bacteroidales bacterium]
MNKLYNKKTKVSLLLIFIMLLMLCNCGRSISINFADSEEKTDTSMQDVDIRNYYSCIHEIDSIIKSNDTTIFFCWIDAWPGCGRMFEMYVAPFLEQKPENIGFVSIFLGREHNLSNLLKKTNCTYPTYQAAWDSEMDAIRIYCVLNSHVKGYKFKGTVPTSVMCNKEGDILNYNPSAGEYSHIVDCIANVLDSVAYEAIIEHAKTIQ